jgi:hypothetical protein
MESFSRTPTDTKVLIFLDLTLTKLQEIGWMNIRRILGKNGFDKFVPRFEERIGFIHEDPDRPLDPDQVFEELEQVDLSYYNDQRLGYAFEYNSPGYYDEGDFDYENSVSTTMVKDENNFYHCILRLKEHQIPYDEIEVGTYS